MVAVEVWKLVVSVVVPVLTVFGAMVAVPRLRTPACLPPACRPFVLTALLASGAVLMIVLLHAGPGDPVATAAAEVAEQEEQEEQDDADDGVRRIRIYEFESWGEETRRAKLAPTMSRAIRETLVDAGLWAKRGNEQQPPVGLHDFDGVRPDDLIRHYSKMAPFVAITGYISRRKDGHFEAKITVSQIDRTARDHTMLEKVVAFTESQEAQSQATRDLEEAIIEVIMGLESG